MNPENSKNIASDDFVVTYRNKYCNPVISMDNLDLSDVALEWGASPVTKTLSEFAVTSDCDGVEFE